MISAQNSNQLNALGIKCPDLFLAIRQFINITKIDKRYAIILSDEPKAKVRIMHVCTAYDYVLRDSNDEGCQTRYTIDLQPYKV